MNKNATIEIPFVWPDSQKLVDCERSAPDLNSILADSLLVLGVVHGITNETVERLAKLLAPKHSIDGNGNGQPSDSPEMKIRLIVTLYPTCPTQSETLLNLLRLQDAHPSSLEIRLATCGLFSGPENSLACYKTAQALPIVFIGSAANLNREATEPCHFTLGFSPEPTLAAEWARWFDVRWLTAVRLTDERAEIPPLELPEGTLEAAQQWAEYEALCLEDDHDEAVEITVDPVTGEVLATDAEGNPVTTISTENKLPSVSPVYRRLTQLLEKGHLVSVDKTTRLLPFEVPVKPKWFGLETLTQIGSVKRQVSYHISALTEDELKQLENRRKKTSELLDVFSFSLADGQRWMPSTAEELFRDENSRINSEAKGILTKLIAGNLDQFMAERRKMVSDDANRMYHDLFPDRKLSDAAVDEMMATLKKRFEDAQQRSFLPQLSFNRVSLPQPQESAWKSQLGSALHLLLSIARYPRKACRNSPYFARGLTAKTQNILGAMDVLNDPFVAAFDRSDARERAESELDTVDEIESSDLTAEEKCERLFALLGHQLVADGASLSAAMQR